MAESPRKKQPDPHRIAVLRALPLEVKKQITGEEAEAFMYNLELPDSLLEKLKDYLDEDEIPKEKDMKERKPAPCPTCQGKKVIEGICEVSSEWRGSKGELANDTQCTPDQTCPTCKGTGYEE